MRVLRERDIEIYLSRRVQEAGGEVRKVQWIGRRGAPDRLVLLFTGESFFAEIKRPGETWDPHQRREANKLELAGFHVELLTCKNDIDEALDRYA